MKLNSISIQNYKSVKDISFSPKNFSVIVGRNGSGKSNLADALEFLSLAYADGLEHAVARKGGYENIAHRKERRSRSALSFRVELQDEFSLSDYEDSAFGRNVNRRMSRWTFRHGFDFRATGEGIRSEFRIAYETLEVICEPLDYALGDTYQWVKIERDERGKVETHGDINSLMGRAMLFDPEYWTSGLVGELSLPPTELLFALPFFRRRIVGRFTSWMQNIGIFQLSPEIARNPGVPTPNPHLSARGENLPAVVDWLQRKQPREWAAVLQAMRDIVPEITEISVQYLHTRTLGLLFSEQGVGRSWTAEEVSDGTIRALSLLVACFDPRNTALIVEEPENSLHPWIIKEIVENLKRISLKKPVVVTSHSPIVLNMMAPEEVWVIYKADGETQLRPLTHFDDMLASDWADGKYRLFEYLESGFVPEAVPSPL